MNWFAPGQVSADSMLQTGLPFLEVFCALVGIIAVLMFLIVVLHTVFAVRSSDSQFGFKRYDEAQPRVDRVPLRPLLR
jgi:hypothetical protein